LANETIIFAVAAGVIFSFSGILVRLGVIKGDPAVGTAVSVFIGTIVLFLANLFTGQLTAITSLSFTSILYLAAAGLINFYFGRLLYFTSVKMIGVARAQPLLSGNIVYVVILGVVFLGESLRTTEVIGVTLMMLGTIIVSISSLAEAKRNGQISFSKGVGLALVASVFRAVAPILIALGLTSGTSPILGALVAYLFAAAGWSSILLSKKKLLAILTDHRSFKIFALQGTLVGLAQIFRFLSIGLGTVIVVTPVFTSVSPVLIVLMAHVLLQKIEHVNLNVWVSVFLVFGGTILTTM